MEVFKVIKEVDNDTAKITLSCKTTPLVNGCNGQISGENSVETEAGRSMDDQREQISDENLTENEKSEQSNTNECINKSFSLPEVEPKTAVTSSMSFSSGIESDFSKQASSGMFRDYSGSSGSDKSPSFPSPNLIFTRGNGSSDCWTDDPYPSENKDEVTNAELGISEDHFSQPEGHFCLSTHEELEMAIENCKEMILETPEKSEKRKNLVKKLIELRMKLQEIKDGPEFVPPDMKIVLGHHFLKKQIQRPKHYCEKCSGIIWGMLQTWHQCMDCGFSCHGKCLNLISRPCASVKVAENPTYIDKICPEKGLSTQGYRCAECKTHIMFKNSWVEPRLCDYNGFYYCPNCHWNSLTVIPARVIHNWDFEQYKVCRASKQFIRLMKKKAILNIQEINPMLFTFIEELSLVRKLREEILIMKRYFLSCKNALQQKMLLLLAERQHFVDSANLYSMQDLIDINSGILLDYLNKIHSKFSSHIKEECEICRGQGFICELCDNDDVLFPFDDAAAVCSECSWTFHVECFLRKERQCPRCLRKQQRSRSFQD